MPDANGDYTADDRRKLKEAIALGLLEVRFGAPDGERWARYRTFKEMKKILRDMEVELGMCPRRSRTVISGSKGY